MESMVPRPSCAMPGGTRLDHNERFGTLWRRDMKGDEPIVIFRLQESCLQRRSAAGC
jgi:hypothetical protein